MSARYDLIFGRTLRSAPTICKNFSKSDRLLRQSKCSFPDFNHLSADINHLVFVQFERQAVWSAELVALVDLAGEREFALSKEICAQISTRRSRAAIFQNYAVFSVEKSAENPTACFIFIPNVNRRATAVLLADC